jgi:hypothetical protein
MVKWATLVLVVVWGVSAHAAIVVQMRVNDTDDKLEITTRGSCTSGSNPKGCVKALGRQPINFNLVGDKRCPSGELWQLDYVALGMSEGSTGGLTPKAASDFNADVASGEVTPNSQNPNSIQIRNNNSAAYDVWYTVYATCDDMVIDTDPRIENDGSGNM